MIRKHPPCLGTLPPTASSPTLLRDMVFPPELSLIAIHAIQDWEWRYRVKANLRQRALVHRRAQREAQPVLRV